MSIADKVKEVQDWQSEQVKPWPGIVIEVRTMSAAGRMRAAEFASDKDGKVNNLKWNRAVIAECCYDPETNERAFSYEDTEWLFDKGAGPVAVLQQKALELSGLLASSLADAEKNLPSGTDSGDGA